MTISFISSITNDEAREAFNAEPKTSVYLFEQHSKNAYLVENAHLFKAEDFDHDFIPFSDFYLFCPEGKWTWIFYDTDISFGDAEDDRVSHNLSNKALGKQDVTCKTFAVCMMENPDFRDCFLTRLAWQMNNLWTEENVIARIDEIESMIK